MLPLRFHHLFDRRGGLAGALSVFDEREADEAFAHGAESNAGRNGDEGFFKVVDQVAQLEKKLGIYELAQFTPK